MQHDQRFDGWKAIANFLGRERTTASRWARERGLPVHRVPGGQTGTVYALRSELDAWLASDSETSETSVSPIIDIEPVPVGSANDRRRSGVVSIVFAVLIICAALGIWWMLGRTPSATTAPVSIAAVAASTANPETVQFARALNADLARFANASTDLAVYEREPGKARTQYIVRTEIERTGDKVVAQARFVAVKDGEVLWSRRFEQSEPALSMLRETVAANIVGVLRCSFGGLEGERSKARSVDLMQIMTICQDFEESDMAAAQARAQRLTLQRPDLAIGWSLLTVIQASMMEGRNDPALQAQMRANAERARRIAPGSALTSMALTVAKGFAASAPEALPMTDIALQKHPDNPWLLSRRSVILFNLGYVQASVTAAISAHRNNPSSFSTRDLAVRRLAAADRGAEAEQLQDENEQMWPGHSDVIQTRARIVKAGAIRQKLDLLMIRDLEQRFSDEPFVAYQLAGLHERTGDRGAAKAWLERAPVKDALQQWSLLFWPDAAGLRTEPAFFRKMAALGLLRWWVQRGQWPDFCREPGLKYSCANEAAKLQSR